MSEQQQKNQVITIVNKGRVEINKVISVDSFSDEFLDITSELGEISIEGNNLKMEELSHSNGNISVKGDIFGVFYKKPKTVSSLFSRKKK